jgi:hypothetical protein
MAREAWRVALGVRDCLRITFNAAYPLAVAKTLGYTRAEVELALWYWREVGDADNRNDGRWYWKERKVNG